ncbi:MAG: Ig-like domain-containing protein, partial [Candidatus Berkiella sp.]
MRISKNEKKSLNTTLAFEQLEDRILFSADTNVLIPHLDMGSNPSHQSEPATIEIITETTSTQETSSTSHEIAFVDKRIENYEALVNDILSSKNENTNLQIVLLDKDMDGLEKISEILNNTKDVNTIHIFSHSTDGVLKLGAKALTYDNIDAHADTLISWQNALTPDADILLYGCDLAQTDIGQKFIEKISTLTGSDVAASTDTSGSTQLGANWDLEYTTGAIESDTLIKANSNISWSGILNTAPTASNNTIQTQIGATYTFTAADFNFQDLEGDSFSQIQILTLPLIGGLFLSGNSILLLDTISISDINNGNFTFNPLLGILGTSFTFKVHDGTVYSDATYTMTLNLSPNNTPPTAANNTVTFDEDSSYTISVSDFQYSDAENNSLNQVRITTLPTNGLLTLSGVAVTLNQTINVADIESGNLIFTPAANANGVGYASFGFSVRDGIGFSVSSYTLTFNVTPTNDLPTTANQTVSTNEDTAYSFTTADFNFSDIDGDSLSQIRINSLPVNGSLTLSGVAVALNQIISAADITAGNLQFTPAANDHGVGYASFNFSVHDGAGFSLAGATMTIDVAPVNDLPATANQTVSTNEDTAYSFTMADFNFSDIDGDSLSQIRINSLPANGSLTLSGVAVALNQIINAADITAGNLQFTPAANDNGVGYASFNFSVHDGTGFSLAGATMTIDVIAINDLPTTANQTVSTNEDTAYSFTTADFNFSDIDGDSLSQIRINSLPANGSLTLSGVAVALNQIISAADINAGNLRFTPAANVNGVGYASFNFSVHDGTGFSLAGATMTIDVIAVNDLPTTANQTVSTNEDAAYSFTSADFNFNDIDGDSLSQIRINSLPANGSLTLSGVAVALNQIISAADINAGNLRFTPAANDNGVGYASFNFSVHDGTGFSLAGATMTIDVIAINDLPTTANQTVSTNEDTAYSFTTADFNFSDIDGDSLSQIRINSLPVNGSLTLSGVAVALNQLISAADITAGNLQFTPAANDNGVGYASFNFSVHDGTGFSLAGATMTIDVIAINDLPTTANQTISTNEDTAYSFTTADFNFSDIDGDSLSQIRINSLPANGSLTLSGVAVALNQIISVADINAGNLRFTPAANANGVGYASFNFSVHDGTGFSLAGATMTIDVIAVNDLPTTANQT